MMDCTATPFCITITITNTTPKTIFRKFQIYEQELQDGYVPRPCALTRDRPEFWKADGDTWMEIGVATGGVDTDTCELSTRSLFYSTKTQLGYWDEPPTGASRVVWKSTVATSGNDENNNTDATKQTATIVTRDLTRRHRRGRSERFQDLRKILCGSRTSTASTSGSCTDSNASSGMGSDWNDESSRVLRARTSNERRRRAKSETHFAAF